MVGLAVPCSAHLRRRLVLTGYSQPVWNAVVTAGVLSQMLVPARKATGLHGARTRLTNRSLTAIFQLSLCYV